MFSSVKRHLHIITSSACLILIAIIACRIDKSGTEDSKQNKVLHPKVIVHLKDDLVPTNTSLKYQATENITNVISKFIKQSEKRIWESRRNLESMRNLDPDFQLESGNLEFLENLPADRQHINNMMVLNGSADKVYYGSGDLGFFSTIYEAYNNHWAVRTVPDDWWYTIIRTVAIAIDKYSKKKEVRDYFVDFEGKKKLTVKVDRRNGIDYNRFFRLMTDLVQSNIKVDGYIDTIRSDFTTSTSVHRISSEITIMSSMQEFFEYLMRFECGIPYVELVGTERDWLHLKEKFLKLKSLLQPIQYHIYLADWWGRIEVILDKLIESYRGNADIIWWGSIFTEEKMFGSGDTTYIYDGWFLKDLLNIKGSLIESLNDVPSGLVSVPLTFILEIGSEVKGALSSGIAGIKLDQTMNPPVVQAAHGWAIFAEQNIEV